MLSYGLGAAKIQRTFNIDGAMVQESLSCLRCSRSTTKISDNPAVFCMKGHVQCKECDKAMRHQCRKCGVPTNGGLQALLYAGPFATDRQLSYMKILQPDGREVKNVDPKKMSPKELIQLELNAALDEFKATFVKNKKKKKNSDLLETTCRIIELLNPKLIHFYKQCGATQRRKIEEHLFRTSEKYEHSIEWHRVALEFVMERLVHLLINNSHGDMETDQQDLEFQWYAAKKRVPMHDKDSKTQDNRTSKQNRAESKGFKQQRLQQQQQTSQNHTPYQQQQHQTQPLRRRRQQKQPLQQPQEQSSQTQSLQLQPSLASLPPLPPQQKQQQQHKRQVLGAFVVKQQHSKPIINPSIKMNFNTNNTNITNTTTTNSHSHSSLNFNSRQPKAMPKPQSQQQKPKLRPNQAENAKVPKNAEKTTDDDKSLIFVKPTKWLIEILCPHCQLNLRISDFSKHFATYHCIPIECMNVNETKRICIDPKVLLKRSSYPHTLFLVNDIVRDLGGSAFRNYYPIVLIATAIYVVDSQVNEDVPKTSNTERKHLMLWLSGIYLNDQIQICLKVISMHIRDTQKCLILDKFYPITFPQRLQNIHESGSMLILSPETLQTLTNNGTKDILLEINVNINSSPNM